MRIDFYFTGDSRYFVVLNANEIGRVYRFDDALNGFASHYGSDTDMFQFLDSELSPSCIVSVHTTIREFTPCVFISYDAEHISSEDLASYLIPYTSDIPF